MNTTLKEYLDIAVLQEKRPVTYKLLARKLGIHVNTAKQALYEYASTHPSVHSIYCITGMTAPNDFHVQLVHAVELDDAKRAFTQLTGVHVYSILPYKPEDLSVLVTATKEIPSVSLDDRIKCGLLKNTNVTKTAERHAAPVSKPAPAPVPTPAPAPLSTPLQPKTAPSNNTSSKTSNTKQTKSTTGKRKGTLSFTPTSKTKKQAVEPNTTLEDLADEKESSGAETSDEEVDRRLAQSATVKASDLFSDDEDTVSVDQAVEQPQHIVAESELVDMTVDEDMEDPTTEEVSEPVVTEEKAAPSSPTPGKVRRKVTKKITYKDDRGYMVTKDVVEWETVDAPVEPEKTTESARPKPSPTNKKTTGKKTGGEQKSLLSFWGKQG